LIIPEEIAEKTYLVVEPNNSGSASVHIFYHEGRAKLLCFSKHLQVFLRELQYPVLIPIFPRVHMIYTHALTRVAMQVPQGPMARLDLQLLAMIADAKAFLMNQGIEIQDKVLLNGFSASSKFVTRFTLFHPDKVKGLAAGGVNGILTFPLDAMLGENLPYPVGIYDLETITGSAFNSDEYSKIPQFVFMGDKDDRDSLPYNDSFSETERDQVYRLFGKTMFSDRWEKTQNIFNRLGYPVQFETYNGIGHFYSEQIVNDIVNL
jgi:pimeloyl-ACP methyl ester carboxylesterase